MFRHPDDVMAIHLFASIEKACFAASTAARVVQVSVRELFEGRPGTTFMIASRNPSDINGYACSDRASGGDQLQSALLIIMFGVRSGRVRRTGKRQAHNDCCYTDLFQVCSPEIAARWLRHEDSVLRTPRSKKNSTKWRVVAEVNEDGEKLAVSASKFRRSTAILQSGNCYGLGSKQ